MNKYTQWLDLDFDPFAPGAKSGDFYCSDQRQYLLDQIVEFSLYSNALIAVTGPLGAGKSTLAKNFSDRFADEAVCVSIAATMFMNQNQFLEALQDALSFKRTEGAELDSAIQQICQYASELDLEARSLILMIDDAHELSAEVLELLMQLLEDCVDSSIHALLFGENQLDNLLQSTLADEAQERLAVFALDGFASDETHEYIRFKLAAAGFTKELPLSGGIVGEIYNTSQGMPGLINSLTVDALNSAAPASELDEIEDIGPIFSGERIDPIGEYEEIEALPNVDEDLEETEASESVGIAGIQSKYWAAAAVLVVLLTGTLMFWDTAERETESIPIAVAAAPTDEQAIAEEAAVAPAPETSAQPSASSIAVADESAPVIAETFDEIPDAESDSEAMVDTQVVETQVAENIPEPELPLTDEVVVEEAVIEVAAIKPAEVEQISDDEDPQVEDMTVLASASPFEEHLLQVSPENYAVQLLASHSESNISEFVAELGGDVSAGYFETRFQGKPWFVAVLAAFDDRDQASRAIASMPPELRSNEPWIRSVAGIQTDIRELLSSKLVSVK